MEWKEKKFVIRENQIKVKSLLYKNQANQQEASKHS